MTTKKTPPTIIYRYSEREGKRRVTPRQSFIAVVMPPEGEGSRLLYVAMTAEEDEPILLTDLRARKMIFPVKKKKKKKKKAHRIGTGEKNGEGEEARLTEMCQGEKITSEQCY